MGKRAAIFTVGCRLNQAESALLAERLVAAGYSIVPFSEPADLGIIHTCTVTREADAKSRKMTRAFIRRNPDAFVAVIGCYSEVAPETLGQIEGVDLIVGNREKLELLGYVTNGKNAVPVIVSGELPTADFTLPVCGTAPLTHRANLKIQDGCDAMCSYCVIPYARGRARSRTMDNLLDEAARLVERGVKEIVLTGVNVGRYACAGQTLLDVIDRLDATPGLERIRLSSIEMHTMCEVRRAKCDMRRAKCDVRSATCEVRRAKCDVRRAKCEVRRATCEVRSANPDALLRRMNDPACALVPFLHVPLQSGADAILERMNRHYTGMACQAFFQHACDSVRDLCLGTDVLVGFPGETQADFEATCQILEQSPIAYAHVFRYSERPDTPAAAFPGKLTPKVIRERSAQVRALSAAKRRAFHERNLGKTLPVLFEAFDGHQWSGYTGNYIRVAVCSEEDLRNRIRPVMLERSCGDLVIGSLCDG